jgi:hypothetical protein
MQFSNLSALSLSELKALATENNVVPTGDKRAKQSWIDAIELFAACETMIEEIHAPTEDEPIDFNEMMAWCDGYIADIATKSVGLPQPMATEIISDAEMEAIIHTADIAKEIIDRLEELSVEPENETEAEFEARSGEYIGLSEVLGDIQTEIKAQKKGAATVFSALLMILILTVQAILCIGCVVVQAAIHLKNLFGSYNPDYDLFGQLNDMVRRRKLDIACA